MASKYLNDKKVSLNKKILLLIILIVASVIVVSCANLTCEEPAIIDQENNKCCDDINRNHVCDEKEGELTWPAGKIVDAYNKLPIAANNVDLNLAKKDLARDNNNNNNLSVEKISEDKIMAKKNRIAKILTDKGTIRFELFEDKAPNTAKNFIALAGAGFYNGLTFHRYVPGFVIQGGDPTGDGTGGSGKNIKLEINKDLKHELGAVAMARSSDPDSASSQFYITLAETTNLDGQYAVFGKVIEGIDTVMLLRQGDVMKEVSIE